MSERAGPSRSRARRTRGAAGRSEDRPEHLPELPPVERPEQILAAARHLQQYEAKGLDTCNPPPTPVFEEYSGFRDELVNSGG